MNPVKTHIWLYCLAAVLVSSCIDPYEPTITKSEKDILVVEGTISGEGIPTTIQLSRTVGLTEKESANPETGATVLVESDTGTRLALPETEDGTYTDQIPLDVQQKYRLFVHTADGLEYATEFMPVLQTPAIDSINWVQDDSFNLQIYVNSHDPQNNTHYYRWQYQEDWEFTAWARSMFDIVNGSITERPWNENVHNCWNKKTSNNMMVFATTHLSKDLVYRMPIQRYETGDRTLSVLYRIRVWQYALSRAAYNYWETVKKNTENTNDLFAPQPSHMPGNISCISDPEVLVVGFVEACIPTVSEKYIARTELLNWTSRYPSRCLLTDNSDVNPYCLIESDITRMMNLISSGYIILTMHDDYSYYMLPAYCGDCRYDGTKERPDNWPTETI